MCKIGRYRIAFSRTFVVQTRVPTTVRRCLFFWVFREARPDDVDSKQNFPINTGMELVGRKFRYCMAGEYERKQELVVEPKETE